MSAEAPSSRSFPEERDLYGQPARRLSNLVASGTRSTALTPTSKKGGNKDEGGEPNPLDAMTS